MEQNSNIRNFCIIAHIDHGKSTLADRFLELTGAVDKSKMVEQYLDSMDLEREKGITIKMQPVTMHYKGYTLNLIDTPGHYDFSYEVSRSLKAVEGAILLVDATKGVQAQTIYNLEMALSANLEIIPAINKIDLPLARIDEVLSQLSDLLGVKEDEVFKISAKTGQGVEKLLEAVIERIPPPSSSQEKRLKALIFDSLYDNYKGVVAFVRVFEGEVKADDKILLFASKEQSQVKEVGIFTPDFKPKDVLRAGEIGYIATGIKDVSKVRVGDTIFTINDINYIKDFNFLKPLEGYKEPLPNVFMGIYPKNPEEFDDLKNAFQKIKLTDWSFHFEAESPNMLGRGFRCGCLGTLHAEIIVERIKREFGLELLLSVPQPVYKYITKDNKEDYIYSPSQWPNLAFIKEILEPWVNLRIIVPSQYASNVYQLMDTLETKEFKDIKNLSSQTLLMEFEVPLREIIYGFYNNLKNCTQGYASMSYENIGYKKANLVKLDVLILGKKEEAFSKIVSAQKAQKEAKNLAQKIKENIPPQLFAVPVQVAIGGKIIARETVKARRKDVTAPLYGGDVTRKMKLLEKQKKGKKEMQKKGRVRIPYENFIRVFTQE
ncbi:Elongation factor 4 [bacterium HR34]|nr:Elongation factor 4 [bacterium HR34]